MKDKQARNKQRANKGGKTEPVKEKTNKDRKDGEGETNRETNRISKYQTSKERTEWPEERKTKNNKQKKKKKKSKATGLEEDEIRRDG